MRERKKGNNAMKKAWHIFLNALPILIMIGLIPLVQNDYSLTLIDVVIVVVSLLIHRERKDFTIFIFGFISMIICEYFFVRTGVEIFNRHSLFGLMPLWLPILWGYGFIGIKRGVKIIGS
jgi:hypothetical protein